MDSRLGAAILTKNKSKKIKINNPLPFKQLDKIIALWKEEEEIIIRSLELTQSFQLSNKESVSKINNINYHIKLVLFASTITDIYSETFDQDSLKNSSKAEILLNKLTLFIDDIFTEMLRAKEINNERNWDMLNKLENELKQYLLDNKKIEETVVMQLKINEVFHHHDYENEAYASISYIIDRKEYKKEISLTEDGLLNLIREINEMNHDDFIRT